jgi:hypothetical protein
MKILLRNKLTANYFQGVEDWTSRLEQAFNFQSPERAAKFVVAALLTVSDIEVVFAFDNPAYNFFLPIDERFGVASLGVKRPSARPKPLPLWPAGAIQSDMRTPPAMYPQRVPARATVFGGLD